MLHEMGIFMRMLGSTGEFLSGPTVDSCDETALTSCSKHLITRKIGASSEKEDKKK